MKKNIIDAIETKLGYEFKDKALLIQAFTRESYAKEQRVKGLDVQSNEQLEYFGDSVLNYLVVCGQLDYFTKVMDGTGLHVLYKEGKLSEFNSHWTDKTMLSQCIDALGFAEYLIMSKGDINQKANENKSVKEDLFESLVGAMWIDSDKDISRIKNVVYSMLNIKFESANVEKNYYSQFVEFVEANNCRIVRRVEKQNDIYEVELGIDINDYLGVDGSQIWTKYGYGKSIKEAEVDAAKSLIDKLRKYDFIDVKKRLPKKDYDKENAINFLQELSQKGYIGEVIYEDELCFSPEKKPYWKVKCKISNYIINFFGTNDSKKVAKKNAAYDALTFIYLNYNDLESNPMNKAFKIMVSAGDNPELFVYIIDSFSDFVLNGTIYPLNKKADMFLASSQFDDENGVKYEVYDEPVDALFGYLTGECQGLPEEAMSFEERNSLSLIRKEYALLPNNIKNNGISLREALLNIANKLKK